MLRGHVSDTRVISYSCSHAFYFLSSAIYFSQSFQLRYYFISLQIKWYFIISLTLIVDTLSSHFFSSYSFISSILFDTQINRIDTIATIINSQSSSVMIYHTEESFKRGNEKNTFHCTIIYHLQMQSGQHMSFSHDYCMSVSFSQPSEVIACHLIMSEEDGQIVSHVSLTEFHWDEYIIA